MLPLPVCGFLNTTLSSAGRKSAARSRAENAMWLQAETVPVVFREHPHSRKTSKLVNCLYLVWGHMLYNLTNNQTP